ncbi:MAG: hypothetical protein VZR53_11380 [Prevotella sp.]|jgi:hypothetical protein|nr:hypothetical protein [Prevotella sp.]
MVIDKEYLETIKMAREQGYEVLARVQVYCFDIKKNGIRYFKEGGRPYLIGKPIGNATLLKIARSSCISEFVSIGSTKLSRNIPFHDIDIIEEVMVDSRYQAEDCTFYFRNPF